MRRSTTRSALDYYSEQGCLTDPGREAYLLDPLPTEVADLCRVAHGVMIHLLHAHRYGVHLSESRKREVEIRRVQEKLGRILELDERPLAMRRHPSRRAVGTCRDFAVLLCSMLRHQGRPARVRGGFATYFPSLPYEDHWVCEVWDDGRERWSRVDAQLDAIQLEQMNIDLDPLDVPDEQFISAGRFWRMCRDGDVDLLMFGDSATTGLQFVRDYVVRDIMALCRVELLPWDPVVIPGRRPAGPLDDHMIEFLADCSILPDTHHDMLNPAREMMQSPDANDLPRFTDA